MEWKGEERVRIEEARVRDLKGLRRKWKEKIRVEREEEKRRREKRKSK